MIQKFIVEYIELGAIIVKNKEIIRAESPRKAAQKVKEAHPMFRVEAVYDENMNYIGKY